MLNTFLITFIAFLALFGLFCVPLGICREDEGKGIFGFLKGLAVALAFSLLASGLLSAQIKVNKDNWNNGVCPTCEEKWEFNGASQYRNSKTYYYECPECEKIIEIKK
jgi:hypothetical protein